MMSGRMDGVTLSMTRAVLDAQEMHAAAQRATQLVELQQRESLRVEAEDRLRRTRQAWGSARSRQAASGHAVEAVDQRAGGGSDPRRRYPQRGGAPRALDARADALPATGPAAGHPSLGTRLDVRA